MYVCMYVCMYVNMLSTIETEITLVSVQSIQYLSTPVHQHLEDEDRTLRWKRIVSWVISAHASFTDCIRLDSSYWFCF